MASQVQSMGETYDGVTTKAGRAGDSTTSTAPEESFSSNSYDENSLGEVAKPVSSTSQSSNSSSGRPITTEDVKRLKEELNKNLEEEQMLLSLQMQLMTQLENLNT